jgi:excisionase family DNA binding protein
MEHDLMTVTEVSEGLRVSKMTIYRLIDQGHLGAIRVGRTFRVHRAAYEAFRENGSQ